MKDVPLYNVDVSFEIHNTKINYILIFPMSTSKFNDV